MCLACDVFNGKLCKKCSLAVEERQLLLWNNVDEVWPNIQRGFEKMGMSFKVFIATRVLVSVWLFYHIYFYKQNSLYYYRFININILI